MFGRFFNKNNTEQATNTETVEPEKGNSSMGNLSAEKLKSVIISLNNAEPIFQQAGYILEQLDVEFGHEPKLTPHFKLQSVIEEQQQEQLLEQLADQQLIRFILISLFKSGRMQSLFDESELYYYGMEIDISSVPSVRTIFRRKDTVAEVVPIKS
ncbi:MAG: hypothetical protein ABJI60_09205 [Kangiellaceae bacterium]|jgi:hypothetical protein